MLLHQPTDAQRAQLLGHGYTIEDVSRYDCGPTAYSFGAPDGRLDDIAYDDENDAWAAAWAHHQKEA